MSHAPREAYQDFDYDALDREDVVSPDDSASSPSRFSFDAAEVADVAPGRLLGPALTPERRRQLLLNPEVRALCMSFGLEVLSIVRRSDHARYQADCLVIAMGGELRIDGSTTTVTAIATENGRTKAAVSKTSRQLAEELGLPPGQYNKNPHVRGTYRRRNRTPIKLADPA